MTQERLKNYQAIKREWAQLAQQLERIEATMYAPRAQRLTGVPSARSVENPLDSLVDHRQELLERYQAKLDELAAEQLAVEKAIESLTPVARTALRYHYIDGMTWEKVCVQMSYSWRQIHRIHAYALRQLAQQG